jgi:hypothetical protein
MVQKYVLNFISIFYQNQKIGYLTELIVFIKEIVNYFHQNEIIIKIMVNKFLNKIKS